MFLRLTVGTVHGNRGVAVVPMHGPTESNASSQTDLSMCAIKLWEATDSLASGRSKQEFVTYEARQYGQCSEERLGTFASMCCTSTPREGAPAAVSATPALDGVDAHQTFKQV